MKLLLSVVIALTIAAGTWLPPAVAGDTSERRIQEGEDALRERAKRETPDREVLGSASPRTAAGPMNKDACKDDGWRGFPDHGFTSEQDCKRFVDRQSPHGRRLPAQR